MCYYSTASDPMIITGCKIPNDDGCDIQDLWGSTITNSQSTINFEQIPACFGKKKPLKSYYCQNVDIRVGSPTLPDMMKDINIYTMMNGPGNPPITWEYRPQVCALKCSEPYPYYRSYNTKTKTNFLYGTKQSFSSTMNLLIGTDGNSFVSDKAVNIPKKNVDIPYTTHIEQAGAIMHGLNEYADGLQPPTLHVGVMPLNA